MIHERYTRGLLVAMLLWLPGCASHKDEPVAKQQSELGAACGFVPQAYIFQDDGCDCPANGDTSCDPDCAEDNQGGRFCGCQFCFGSLNENPETAGQQCADVPSSVKGQADGCDCPANGDTSCDPDCAESGNKAGGACGCQGCHGAGEALPLPPLGTPPAVTAPTIGTSARAGALPASKSVGPDGQFRYSVPIRVPEGRAGMTPRLSLDYSSSGADDLLGVGWSLRGLSAIRRCAPIEAQQGASNQIAFSRSDPYCLDGQRTILASGDAGRTNAIYRTEIDNGARLKILAHADSGPTRWEVRYSSGRIAIYELPSGHGVSRTNREVNGQPILLAGLYALNWPIANETDRSGNRIEYKYTMEDGIEYPSSIDYTTCSGTPCSFTRMRRVEFGYEARPVGDRFEHWVNGSRTERKSRLTEIRTKITGDSGAATVVDTYRIRYVQSAVSGRSLLDGIKICDSAEGCLAETTFSWAGESATQAAYNLTQGGAGPLYFDTLVNLLPESNAGESSMVLFDANGDGNDDVVLKRWPAPHDTNGTILAPSGDPNARGPEDLLLLGDGGGYFAAPQVIDHDGDGLDKTEAACGEMEIMDPGGSMPVDLDGDGYVELVARVNTNCPWVSLSGAWQRNAPGVVAQNLPGYRWAVFGWDDVAQALRQRAYPRIDALPYNAAVQFVDIDGDGLRDLAWSDPAQGSTWRVHRAALTPQLIGATLDYDPTGVNTLLPGPNVAYWRARPDVTAMIDEDGDGREELFQTKERGLQLSYRWTVDGQAHFLSRDPPSGTTNSVITSATNPSTSSPWLVGSQTVSDSGVWHRLDINGDGLQDVLYRQKTPSVAWKMRINTGNGFTPPAALGAGNAALDAYLPDEKLLPSPSVRQLDNGMRFADMNGDGRDDIVLFANPSITPGVEHATKWTLYGSPPIRVLYSSGSGFGAPVNIVRNAEPGVVVAKPDQRWMMSAVGDVDGNGLPDLVEFVKSPSLQQRRLVVHSLDKLPAGVDVINSVHDENGPAVELINDSMSAGTRQRIGTNPQDPHLQDTHIPAQRQDCRYPAACTARGRAVRVMLDYRVPAVGHTVYDYRGARVDRKGRGWLGFEIVNAKDEVSGRSTRMEFDLEPRLFSGSTVTLYPHAGRPVVTGTSMPSASSSTVVPDLLVPTGGLSANNTRWTPLYRNAYPVRLQQADTVTEVWQSQQQQSEHTLREEYDATYPFVTLAETTSVDLVSGTRTVHRTTTQYNHDSANWLIGRPQQVVEYSATNADVRNIGCTAAVCSESTVSYDYFYLMGTHLLDTATRRHGSETLVTDNDYGTGGLLSARRVLGDGQTRETLFGYDPSGSFLEGTRNPVGHRSFRLHYPTKGWVLATVDPNGARTIFQRDGLGRVTRIDRSDGSRVSFAYARGRMDRVVNNGASASTTIDSRGRVTREDWTMFDGTTSSLRIQYSSSGGRSLVEYGPTSGPFQQLEKAIYDRLGRPVVTTRGADEFTQYAYGPVLGDIAVTDPKGDIDRTHTDAHGNVTSVTSQSKGPTVEQQALTYRYDQHGELAVVIGNGGGADVIRRDALGRRHTWTTGSETRALLVHNAFGDVEGLVKDGLSLEFTHDAVGRLRTRTETTSGEQQVFVWDQGSKGRLATAIGATGHRTLFTYDNLGRLSERRDVFPSGESLSYGYTYDVNGRLDQMSYPETATNDIVPHTRTGLKIKYGYQNGQLASITEVGGSNPVLWRATQRHRFGMITQQNDLAGVGTATTYHANTLRLATQTVSGVTSGTVPDRSYVYEINGQIQGRRLGKVNAPGAVSEVYTYNGHGQLWRYTRDGAMGIVGVDFTYKAGTGNLDLVDVGTAFNANDFSTLDERSVYVTGSDRLQSWQLGTSTPLGISYDAGGRLTRWSGGGNERTYEYNSFNLPLEIVDQSAGTFTFDYDAFGRRTQKQRTSSNRFVYVGDLYEQRTLSTPNVQESVFRLQTDEGVIGEIAKSWSGGTVTRRMFHTDEQGSALFQTVGKVSTVSGGFSAYGRRMGPAPAQSFSNYGYTGHVQDDDLGLIDMKGRVYDTKLRRFLTRDAVLDQPYRFGGRGAYAYVGGRPTTSTDPTGLQEVSCGAGCTMDTSHRTENGIISIGTVTMFGDLGQWGPDTAGYQSGMDQAAQANADAQRQYDHANAMSGAPGGASGPQTMGPMANSPLAMVFLHRAPQSYAYHQSRPVGRVSDGVTKEKAMALLAGDPNAFFPFGVQGIGSAAHSPGIRAGREYNLVGAVMNLPTKDPIEVIEVTDTSFTFLTLPGHFDGEGSTIRFSTVERDGIVYLEHDADARNTNMLVASFGGYFAGKAWDQQAAALRNALAGGWGRPTNTGIAGWGTWATPGGAPPASP